MSLAPVIDLRCVDMRRRAAPGAGHASSRTLRDRAGAPDEPLRAAVLRRPGWPAIGSASTKGTRPMLSLYARSSSVSPERRLRGRHGAVSVRRLCRRSRSRRCSRPGATCRSTRWLPTATSRPETTVGPSPATRADRGEPTPSCDRDQAATKALQLREWRDRHVAADLRRGGLSHHAAWSRNTVGRTPLSGSTLQIEILYIDRRARGPERSRSSARCPINTPGTPHARCRSHRDS